MELIEDLGTRLIKNTWVRLAKFLCPYCLQEVVRGMLNGKKAKSCGCSKVKLTSEFNKGRKRSEESKRKQGDSNKGRISPMKGKEPWNKGKAGVYTEETIQKMSLSAKNRNKIPENNPMFGKHHTEEAKQKIKENTKGKRKNIGINNPSWLNGISFEPYGLEFNKEKKQQVLERDNYTCQDPNCEHNNKKITHTSYRL